MKAGKSREKKPASGTGGGLLAPPPDRPAGSALGQTASSGGGHAFSLFDSPSATQTASSGSSDPFGGSFGSRLSVFFCVTV